MIKIFVGSLPYSTTNQDLEGLFTQFGAVTSAVVINDKFSGRSKGFGFVEMPNDEEAQKAIQELNGYQLDGRSLFVSVAKPREERPRGGFDRDRNSGGGFGGGRRDNFNRRDNNRR